ncbi:MAG: hypothetical protein HYS98_08275, partial [Deltaproteobacteria bacterium]|nr:hypothetical protein [Deltaproteobacteria bacterium]
IVNLTKKWIHYYVNPAKLNIVGAATDKDDNILFLLVLERVSSTDVTAFIVTIPLDTDGKPVYTLRNPSTGRSYNAIHFHEIKGLPSYEGICSLALTRADGGALYLAHLTSGTIYIMSITTVVSTIPANVTQVEPGYAYEVKKRFSASPTVPLPLQELFHKVGTAGVLDFYGVSQNKVFKIEVGVPSAGQYEASAVISFPMDLRAAEFTHDSTHIIASDIRGFYYFVHDLGTGKTGSFRSPININPYYDDVSDIIFTKRDANDTDVVMSWTFGTCDMSAFTQVSTSPPAFRQDGYMCRSEIQSLEIVCEDVPSSVGAGGGP